MTEGWDVGARIGAKDMATQERSDKRKDQISALIRANMDAILAKTYTLKDLLNSLGQIFPTMEALTSFLTLNYRTYRLVDLAKVLLDAEIYEKKMFYDARLKTLLELITEKQIKLDQNPNDAERQEALALAQESIPNIKKFIDAVDALQAAADDKTKAKLRTDCSSMLKEMEKPKNI